MIAWRKLLAPTLLAALMLAGCGGGSGDDDEPDRVGAPPAPDCRAKPELCA